MVELTIKVIKGNKYLYLRDRVKVNSKSLSVQTYVGRLEKVEPQDFSVKLLDLFSSRLTKYLDYRLEHYTLTVLDRNKATNLESLRYFYDLFEDLYPDESERYQDAMYVRYVQGTTAIEGNTITFREAQELLEHNISPAGKRMDEVYEVLNYITLGKHLSGYTGDITEAFIKKIHEILMNHILRDPGNYRNIQVGIANVDYQPPPAILVPDEMQNLIRWYRQNRKTLNPFELAILLHTKFEIIHPFVDGNGRVGRALMNFILERSGYPTLYLGREHRAAYLDALVRADDEEFAPIVKTLYEFYQNQHGQIAQEVQQKLKDGGSKFRDDIADLLRQYIVLKKNG
ncbi:MAG: Fic family protein [Methanomicrobiales archaeon]|nr:Fic family protein [Methanomicrobiales archaeon]